MRRHRDEPFLLFYPAILTHIPVATTPLARDETATPRAKFASMVHYADHLIGRLIKALDALQLRDNTLVVITTDNGTDSGTDQGRPQSLGGRINGRISSEGIYSLRETGINVPFIVSGPKWIPRGRESDALINAADILPTLADFAGAKLPRGVTIDGRSFAPVVRLGSDGCLAAALDLYAIQHHARHSRSTLQAVFHRRVLRLGRKPVRDDRSGCRSEIAEPTFRYQRGEGP